jgi:predicted amidophosphoribosyltransferase
MSKLLLIDEMVIDDHHYLRLGIDKCFYYFVYTSDKGFSHSKTNELILNFKKKLDRQGKPDFKYKGEAIKEIAKLLSNLSQNSIDNSTFVPVPPSKSKTNPLYDDRIVQALRLGLKEKNADIRELVNQASDTVECHISGKRDVKALESILEIDEDLVDGVKEYIVIVDDVLTTGCHYIAMKNVLLKRFPDAKIIGLFIARREIMNDDFEI